MKIKHFEYIVIYLSVLLVCVLIGVVGRLVLIGKGADEYTANVFFWICIGFGILLFAILSLFLNELVGRVLKYFLKNKKEKLPKSQISNSTIEEIKAKQQTIIADKQQTKIDVSIHYTQKEFALYITDEDLKLLCDYVIMYAEKLDFENIKPIKVNDLSNLDLYHFGWNIWNYFKVSKQDKVAQFLKLTFAEALKGVEENSIKTHLKDDDQKGIIKITENLSQF